MCGAVSAGRLTVVPFVFVTVTCMGTSPAPASEAGNENSMMSKPAAFVLGLTEIMLLPVIAVVPIVMVTSPAAAKRTPVTLNKMTVGSPLVVTLNGSDSNCLVCAAALLPGSVKMSGCEGVICTLPRTSVSVFAPAFRILIATVARPEAVPIGTTKLICLSVLLTR